MMTGVEPITEAHIHKAPSTTNGPVVVPFEPDYSAGCTQVSRELALDIVLHPRSYYVNVHNAEFPRPRGARAAQPLNSRWLWAGNEVVSERMQCPPVFADPRGSTDVTRLIVAYPISRFLTRPGTFRPNRSYVLIRCVGL